MKIEEIERLCVWYSENIDQACEIRRSMAFNTAVTVVPKLLAVAKAAKRNSETWDLVRDWLPEELPHSSIDPKHRFPEMLGVNEALEALERE